MSDLPRIRSCHATAAELVALDPIFLPIFERMERELAMAEAEARKDPVERARALLRQREA